MLIEKNASQLDFLGMGVGLGFRMEKCPLCGIYPDLPPVRCKRRVRVLADVFVKGSDPVSCYFALGGHEVQLIATDQLVQRSLQFILDERVPQSPGALGPHFF